MDIKAWCMKCKAKRDMLNAKIKVFKNKRKAYTGTCKKCGTKMFKFTK